MRILLDMNLSPRWVELQKLHGFEAAHWSNLGDIRAPDTEILAWARANGYVLITSDLDFGYLLAVGGENSLSVVLIRGQDRPEALAKQVIEILSQYKNDLEAGSFIVVDETQARVRILPLRGSK